MSDTPRIVLVRPSHPGNIGAVARAMANMGFSRLCLVDPKEYPSPVATARAAGADAILDSASVFETIDDAIGDCRMVVGTTARIRTIDWPTEEPRPAMTALANLPGQACAIVFGNERTGLSNTEVDRCQKLVRIPVDETFPSLNLASAVLVLAYEYRLALPTTTPLAENEQASAKANAAQLRSFYGHVEVVLNRIRFLKVHPPTKLMRKIVRLFNRAEITEEEVNILRGVLTTVEYEMDKRDGLR